MGVCTWARQPLHTYRLHAPFSKQLKHAACRILNELTELLVHGGLILQGRAGPWLYRRQALRLYTAVALAARGRVQC